MPKIKTYTHLLAVIPLTLTFFSGPFPRQNYPPTYIGAQLLSRGEMSLNNRYQNPFVNGVFKDNILLNLAYLSGRVTSSKDIVWDQIQKPFTYEFRLDPDKTFAYHDGVDEKYKATLVKTTNAHFNFTDGFKSSGSLFGDGVCHLASLINKTAQEAGLLVEAPTSHDFAQIPDIAKEYGVSIFYRPGSFYSNARQNLYITNNLQKPVTFRFEYINNRVVMEIIRQS